MQTGLRIQLAVLFMVFAECVCGSVFASSVESILAAQASYFSKIHSIQYDGKINMHVCPEVQQKQGLLNGDLEMSVSFAYDEGEFRSAETFLDNADGETVTRTTAFDGKAVYIQSERNGTTNLVVGQEANVVTYPIAAAKILALPFSFAFCQGNTRDLDVLRDAATWNSLGASATGIVQETMFEHDGYKVTFERDMCAGQATIEVFFAADMSFFPVHGVVHYSDSDSEYTVVNTQQVAIGENDMVVIPTTVKISERSRDDSLEQTITLTIVKSTLKVNQAIDPMEFVISTGEADTVYQADVGAYIKN